jgi:hypothetical protein
VRQPWSAVSSAELSSSLADLRFYHDPPDGIFYDEPPTIAKEAPMSDKNVDYQTAKSQGLQQQRGEVGGCVPQCESPESAARRLAEQVGNQRKLIEALERDHKTMASERNANRAALEHLMTLSGWKRSPDGLGWREPENELATMLAGELGARNAQHSKELAAKDCQLDPATDKRLTVERALTVERQRTTDIVELVRRFKGLADRLFYGRGAMNQKRKNHLRRTLAALMRDIDYVANAMPETVTEYTSGKDTFVVRCKELSPSEAAKVKR